MFSQPAEVDSWCQSITFGQPWPLTPPDTDSEPDMSSQWNQPSLPEEQWHTGPAQDNSTYVQSAGSEWDSQTIFSSTQDFQPAGPYDWNQSTHGSVETGLSPVMSQKSQSTHTLNSISEPDFAVLPPGMDFSFISEPHWSSCAGTQHLPAQIPGSAFVPAPDAVAPSMYRESAMPHLPLDHAGYQGPSHPAYYQQEDQLPLSMVPYHAIAPRRPLLPRNESSSAASAMIPAHASSQRSSRPLIQGQPRSCQSSHSVSTSVGL